MVNYYDVLEISENASGEVIQGAYRTLAKKFHPDTYKGNPEYATSMMQKLNEAYEVLSDTNKRKLYDEELKSFRAQRAKNQENHAQESTYTSTASTSEPVRTSTSTKEQHGERTSGCLSGCLSNLLGLCFWLVVIVACLRYCGNKNDGPGLLDEVKGAITSITTPTPLTDRYDQLVQDTIREAQEADDEEERQSKFTDALGLQASEYSFKATVYEHYTGTSCDDQPFQTQLIQEISSTMDLMKEYLSEDVVDILCVASIDTTFDFFEEMEGEFDYMLGDEWTKKNINVDYLWELFLSKTYFSEEYGGE